MADLKHLEHLWLEWKARYLAGIYGPNAEFVFARTLVKERAKRWRCAG